MNAGWNGDWVFLFGAGAGVLFLVELVVSMVLRSVDALNPVTLHRLSTEGEGRMAFLEEVHSSPYTYRAAAHLLRQTALLGGAALLGAAVREAGVPHPWLLGLLGAAAFGVGFLEMFVARLVVLVDARKALRVGVFLLRPLCAPFRWLLIPLDALLRRVEQVGAGGEEERGPDQNGEAEALIEVGERDGILEADEGKMMRSIVDLGDTRVREIMTPRPDIVALPMGTTVDRARRAVLEAGHSKVPIYRDNIDNVLGVLHVRDLVRAWEEGRGSAPVTAYLRPAFFVPETQTVGELLSRMRLRTHVALVVDEYGGIAGLVTLEDVLEEIVGDIRDEHDTEEEMVRAEPDGSWLFHGLTHVGELEERFGLRLQNREFDTVGGLVIATLGRVPRVGERVSVQGIELEVVHSDPRRVYRVRVRQLPRSPGDGDAPEKP